MIRFAHTEYLYIIALLPLLLLLFLLAQNGRKRAMKRFGNLTLLTSLIPLASRYKRAVKFALVLVSLGFLILGLANPQIGTKMEEVKREGVDIFIALDVSNSMKAEDIKPNRLESAKRQIALLLDKLQNDRIGLIVFAGDSYLQLPLTSDYSAARLFLNAIDVDIVPIQGTAIGSAIRLAMKSFVEGEEKHKVIIVITDGENHEDDAVSAAKEAVKQGVVIHTIGMGSPLGGPIPIYQGRIQVGFKKDNQGNVVITKLDETVLREIAEAGKGTFVRATSQRNELDQVLEEIAAMEKKEFGAKVFTEYEDRFQYFLLLAFVLLVFDFFISERKNIIIERWKNVIAKPLTVQREYTSV
jgi:Ca-activated chloride channel family protein